MRVPVRRAASAAPATPETATTDARAAPGSTAAPPVKRRRIARWKPPVALALGVLALICSVIPGFGLVVGIFAVTKGASTAADLRRTGQGGRGRAIAGEVMGIVAIAASIAIPIVFGFLLI